MLQGIAHVEQERRQVKRRTSKDIDDGSDVCCHLYNAYGFTWS